MSAPGKRVASSRVPCKTCGKGHDAFRRGEGHEWGSWADPNDGHYYRPMSAEEICERYLLIDTESLRRLADA